MTTLSDPIRDITAADREFSHVSGEAYRKLGEIVVALLQATAQASEEVYVGTAEIAQVAIEELTPDEIEGIIQDWLEGRGNIGTL